MTRLYRLILLVAALRMANAAMIAQEPASLPPAGATQEVTALPSVTLKPALDSLQQTLTILRPEKWKTRAEASQTNQANIASMKIDLQTTLPPLLVTADQHPGSVTDVLPAFRNITALYDVLLRVTQVASLSAPGPQSTALQQSMNSLDTSRRKLGDDLQTSAQAQTRQMEDLQAQLRTIKETPPPPPVVCPAPPAVTPPAKKRKARSAAAPAPAAH